MRVIKPRLPQVHREIQTIIRTFPNRAVTIERSVRSFSSTTGQKRLGLTTVYAGEALVIPAGAVIRQLPMGQIETLHPQLLVAGERNIQQGDFVTLDGKRFQVDGVENVWKVFLMVRLVPWEQ